LHNAARPCIRLARGKFELTNQDSAGGKNSSVLCKVNKSGKAWKSGISMEMALDIHEKGFSISKTILVGKK